jgi:hypothetical protein
VEMYFVVSLFVLLLENEKCNLKDAESAPIVDTTFWDFNIWDPGLSSTTTTTTTPPTTHTVTTRAVSTTTVNTLVGFKWQIFC